MFSLYHRIRRAVEKWIGSWNMGMRSKLLVIFLMVKIIPLIFLAAIAWRQFSVQGEVLSDIAVADSAQALNDSAVENIERMSTDAAYRVAEFLYERDADILYLTEMEPTEQNYKKFINSRRSRLIKQGKWNLSADESSWVPFNNPFITRIGGISTNSENNDMNGFKHRLPDLFNYDNAALYDEITFIDLNGNEVIKIQPNISRKKHYPLSPEKRNVSVKENTYVKAEDYFSALEKLKAGEIYVSEVIGAYVGTNFIGMYTPSNVAKAAADRKYSINYEPEKQAYAGRENPNGQRFEGIVRWGTPVFNKDGKKRGYVTFALNHDHIMEFVDHITPMRERYVNIPSANEGNYAFIWDYKARNISHPRHHSIVGYDPETGEPQIPWLESSIYEGWVASGIKKWTDYVKDYPIFYEQSRKKKPSQALTKQGLVGLDCRYLNNAPQCIGWMDLTRDGGSGSFYILWSGLYKLNTAAAIPYYTGRYAPSFDNGFARRGFGFVAIGSGLEYFTKPAKETEVKLLDAIGSNLKGTFIQLSTTTVLLIAMIIVIAFWMASSLTNNITALINGIYRFREGERQFRFNYATKDEFGTLADSFDEMAESIVDSVKNPLSILDINCRVIYMNDYGLELANKTLQQVVGAPYSEVSVYPNNSRYCPLSALKENREADIYHVPLFNLYIKGTARYFYNNNGEQIGYLIETTDMTEMVTKQLELERAMNNAKKANEHKGEFLARMSHEIRTPMNVIIGLANLIQRNLADTDDDQRLNVGELKDHIRQIETSSQHLLGLLNDILDISKIEAGKIALTEENTSLEDILDTVCNIISPRCEEKHINFQNKFDDFSNQIFLSDPLRLRQVLINLLGNAVKFTPEYGRIDFTVKKIEELDDRMLIKFIITDNGIGISPEDKNNIFQAFQQGNDTISRNYGGTGLGLSISRHIINMFGSDISLDSKLGDGSEFSFSIWLKMGEEPLPSKSEISDPTDIFKGKRLLLVDDIDLNRKVAKAMLKVTGIEIEEAGDGAEAVNKFEKSPLNYYNAILMDVLMPKMNGYEASQAIRGLDRPDSKIPIIALTANAFKEDIEKALSFGMNAHVAKPVKIDKLVGVLYKLLSVKA